MDVALNTARTPGSTAVFTIIAKNYLAHARVLMHSIKEHHPEWRRFVILADRVDECFDPDRKSVV